MTLYYISVEIRHFQHGLAGDLSLLTQKYSLSWYSITSAPASSLFYFCPKSSKQDKYFQCSWFYKSLFCHWNSNNSTFSPDSWNFGEKSGTAIPTDMYANNRVLHYVKKKKKDNIFSFSSGQLKIKFTVGSMLDWLKSFRSKERGGLEQRAENFLQTRDCIGGNFVFIVNPVGLLSAASCCLFQFAIKEGNKSPHNRSDQLRTPFRMSF